MLFHLVVPGQTRGKGAGRAAVVGGHAHVFTDSRTRSEMAVIRQLAHEQMKGQPPYEGPVVLHLTAYRQIPASFSKTKRAQALEGLIAPVSKPDLDNHIKMIDSLSSIVIRDDCQIVTIIAHKRYADQPRLEIVLKSW